MQDEKQLKDYVSRCKDGGVKQVLIIGGGREPMGKFTVLSTFGNWLF